MHFSSLRRTYRDQLKYAGSLNILLTTDEREGNANRLF